MKRIFSVVIIISLCMASLNIGAVAFEDEKRDLSEYTIEDLFGMSIEEKISVLEQFEAERFPLEQQTVDSNVQGTISPNWVSGHPELPNYTAERMKTHELMTIEALRILYEAGYCLSDNAATAFVIALYIAEGSALPDREISGIGLLFAGHFYHPETQKNPVGSTTDTARTHMVSDYHIAETHFRLSNEVLSDEYIKALEYLGRMLHYVQDACEPHHSSNVVAGIGKTPHSEFEKYVDENFEDLATYIVWSESEYKQCLLANAKNDPGMIVHRAAIASHAFIDTVNDLDNRVEWENTAKICIRSSAEKSAIAIRIACEAFGVLVEV